MNHWIDGWNPPEYTICGTPRLFDELLGIRAVDLEQLECLACAKALLDWIEHWQTGRGPWMKVLAERIKTLDHGEHE